MLGRLNHVAIAVPDLAAGTSTYAGALGAKVSAPQACPSMASRSSLSNCPTPRSNCWSRWAKARRSRLFSESNPAGGIHHVCYEVDDIIAARDRLKAGGARVLGDGNPKIGAHGKPVLFLHPKDFMGTLVELEEVKA